MIYVMVVTPGSLCHDGRYHHRPVIKLQESYCFVNKCTIRIETSNVLLNIVNNTEGWLLAANAILICLQLSSMVTCIVVPMIPKPIHTNQLIQHCMLFE